MRAPVRFDSALRHFVAKSDLPLSSTGLCVDPEVTSGFTVAGLLCRKSTRYVVGKIVVIRSESSMINVF
ncbi:hypothetical protein D3C85_1076080 [compost metagenome]